MQRRGETALFGITVGSAAASLFSIAVSQILLTAAYILAVVAIVRRRDTVRWPSYFLPLGVFMATTLISLAVSPDPDGGWHPVQKFVLLPMGLLAANLVTTDDRARTAYRVLLAVGCVAALAGIVQFTFQYATFSQTNIQADDPTLVNRITGPLGHWMTFSGVQLLVWCAGVPALMVLARKWLAPLLLMAVAVVLGHTRGAWLGAAAGFAVAVPGLPRRLLLILLVPLAILGIAASPLIYNRILTSFDQALGVNYSRAVYVDVGTRMIADHPLFGVGPERIDDEFPNYYEGSQRDFYFGHLHNNILQIGAERGLIALAAFLWFMVELFRSLAVLLRQHSLVPRWMTLGALSALTGFFVAGFTEYNFGDSEVLLLLLFIVSIPFGVSFHVQKNPHRQQG